MPEGDLAADAAPAQAVPEAAPAPAPDAAPAPAPETPPWEGKSPEELWQLNEKLKQENVSYKERFRPWEQQVGSMHEQDQQFLLGVIQGLQSPDPARRAEAANQMRTALDSLSPAQQKALVDAVEEEWDPYDASKVDERVNKGVEQRIAEYQRQQDERAAIESAQRRLEAHAGELATKHGIPQLGDPSSPIGSLLMIYANNQFKDEPNPMVKLDLAAEAIEKELRLRSQELLKAKAADAGPSPAPADAVEPSGSKKPRDLKDASASARSRLEKLLAGQPGT